MRRRHASGLVAPDLPDTAILKQSDNALTPAEVEVLRRKFAGAKDGAQVELPPQPAEALSIQVERETSMEAPAVAEMQAQAPAVAEMQAQAPTVAEMQAQAPAVAEMQAQAPVVVDLQAETSTDEGFS